MSNDKDDSWETVVSKQSVKREKNDVRRQKIEQFRKNRDVRYLHTHVSFQKHRITRDKAIKLIEKFKKDHNDEALGSLFIVSEGRCVGHLVSVTPKHQVCLQCNWSAKDGLFTHCCCDDSVYAVLPPNFYLGCDGYLNDYLVTMREQPLDESQLN